MNISYVALNRIVEDHAATDEKYRKQLERNGKVFLSSGAGYLTNNFLPSCAIWEST